MNIVIVEWWDAESNDAWVDVSSVPDSPPIVQTVGFVILETKKHIVLAQNFDPTNDKMSNTMNIPRGMIKKITHLR